MGFNDQKPNISTVIIGIDVERTLSECIESVKGVNYPQEKLEIIYVDGGSKDRSVEIAKEFDDVKVVELQQLKPTPGRGRNAGWKVAKYDTIQFLDADTSISPEWFNTSYPLLAEQTVAVCGRCSEKYRDKNNYHLIGDIEWDSTEGFTDAFGGIVLISKRVLQNLEGYDNSLVAGEEPDLSYRIRKTGGKILRVSDLMVYHDLNMTKFSQYWKRSVRTGYAYAEVAMRYFNDSERFWVKELVRIILFSTLPFLLIILGVLTGHWLLGMLVGLGLAFRNLRHIPKFKKKYGVTTWQSMVYSLHLCFVVYPNMAGVVRYFYRKLAS